MFQKRVIKLKKRASFTLIEVLVSMMIIGIASISAVMILSEIVKMISYDKNMQLGIESSQNYMANIYIGDDINSALFNMEELSNINASKLTPILLPPEVIEINDFVTMFVNKKINRLDPLFVDIGIEVIITYEETNRVPRQFWIETTLSEKYFDLMN